MGKVWSCELFSSASLHIQPQSTAGWINPATRSLLILVSTTESRRLLWSSRCWWAVWAAFFAVTGDGKALPLINPFSRPTLSSRPNISIFPSIFHHRLRPNKARGLLKVMVPSVYRSGGQQRAGVLWHQRGRLEHEGAALRLPGSMDVSLEGKV